MEKKIVTGLSSVVFLQSFTVFPEYFISTSVIYVLIVITLITYNVYGLIVQKAISNCMALILLMSCYLLLNDDLLTLSFLSFNNSIANDHLAFFTKFIICFFAALYFFFIADFFEEQRLVSFEYLVIILLAILGLMLLCCSNDLLTAYLAIELTSLSSYILASFRKTSSYSIEAGIKYFVTGAISSAFFLFGSSLVYLLSGSIYIVDLFDLFSNEIYFPDDIEPLASILYDFDRRLDTLVYVLLDIYTRMLPYILNTPLIEHMDLSYFNFLEFGLTLILFSLFIKLALAPFHLWSLDVYEGSPTSSAFFFAVLTKLGIFVFLIRLCYFGLYELAQSWKFYSVLIGIFSIFVGSFGGLKQRKLKTLLAYSSTSHMGYSLLAFSTNTLFGIHMLLFYIVIYMISGLCIWFIMLVTRLKKKTISNKYNKELGDFVLLNRTNPVLAFAFAITMFSIAGIPPLIGFFSKMGIFLALIREGSFASSFYLVALSIILCSVVSTFYYIRIIKILYFENILIGKLYFPIQTDKTAVLGFLLILLIFLFINPTLLYLATYRVAFGVFSMHS